jgi:hypothetical protein
MRMHVSIAGGGIEWLVWWWWWSPAVPYLSYHSMPWCMSDEDPRTPKGERDWKSQGAVFRLQATFSHWTPPLIWEQGGSILDEAVVGGPEHPDFSTPPQHYQPCQPASQPTSQSVTGKQENKCYSTHYHPTRDYTKGNKSGGAELPTPSAALWIRPGEIRVIGSWREWDSHQADLFSASRLDPVTPVFLLRRLSGTEVETEAQHTYSTHRIISGAVGGRGRVQIMGLSELREALWTCYNTSKTCVEESGGGSDTGI